MVAAVALMAWLYVAWGDDHSDIGIYHRYAVSMFGQAGPRHLPVEYPVLALAPFSLTLIPASDYGVAFVVAMAVLLIASMAAVWRTAPRATAVSFTIYLLLAGPWTLFGRYDLVPSLVVLGAVLAAGRGRWRMAYALLAAGVLLKLYPLFLLPLFVIEQWRQGPRTASRVAGPALFALMVAAGLGAAAVLDPAGWLSPIAYALGRPIEGESAPATVLWMISGFHSPGMLVHSFNSVNVVGPASQVVGGASLITLLLGLATAYVSLATGRLSLARACLAALLVVAVTSRVLSPQYLVWILPLVAFEVGLSPLWIAICVLTFLVYPVLYEFAGLSDSDEAATYAFAFLLTVAARNSLLVVAAWRELAGPGRAPSVAAA